MEKSDFEKDFTNLLTEKKLDCILQYVNNPSNADRIKGEAWGLVNQMCVVLKTTPILEEEEQFIKCKDIILQLVSKGTPKEMLVALLEEADTFKENSFFCLLLHPLKETLLKVPAKRGKSLEWVLSSLNAHVQTLSLPEDRDFQEEEKLLLDIDPNVIASNCVLENYLEFLRPFVAEVSLRNSPVDSDRLVQQRNILCRYILMLLNHPLIYHDLHADGNCRPKSTVRVLCEHYVSFFSEMCRNVNSLFQYDSKGKKSNDDDSDLVPSLAFSNLAYLIYVENLAFEICPLVNSHLFVVMKNLKYVNLMLERKENLVLFKGLHLAKALVERLNKLEISYDMLNIEAFRDFPKLLLSVSIFSQFELHRNLAVKLFSLYVSKCDWKGRYHLIMQILATINHSGAEGLVINLYKEYLNECLNAKAINTFFVSKNLERFLKAVFVLKEGAETDILENSDRIITTINFLRYILLRDSRDVNRTGVWNHVGDIEANFLEPLTTGLNFSRAHYKQAEKDALANTRMGRKEPSVSVNGAVLTGPTFDFNKEVTDRAFLTFDMIESILSRVRELL